MVQILWQLFIVFTRIAIFSWGGGPASLALMQREVTAAGWADAGEFADAVALSNALPGPIAPQVSAYVGYKVAGLAGAVSATAGTVLPTTILMLVMIAYFFAAKDNQVIKSMLAAVRPVVVGLLVWTAYDMAGTVFAAKKLGWSTGLLQSWDKVLIAIVAFAVLTFTTINPALVVLAAAIFGFFVYR